MVASRRRSYLSPGLGSYGKLTVAMLQRFTFSHQITSNRSSLDTEPASPGQITAGAASGGSEDGFSPQTSVEADLEPTVTGSVCGLNKAEAPAVRQPSLSPPQAASLQLLLVHRSLRGAGVKYDRHPPTTSVQLMTIKEP